MKWINLIGLLGLIGCKETPKALSTPAPYVTNMKNCAAKCSDYYEPIWNIWQITTTQHEVGLYWADCEKLCLRDNMAGHP